MSKLTVIMYEDTQYPVTCQIDISETQTFTDLSKDERKILIDNIINYYVSTISDPINNKVVKCILNNPNISKGELNV